MSAVIAIFFRLLILYFVIKVLWSLFAGNKNTTEQQRTKGRAAPKRFDAKGHSIDDAEYDDIK